MPEENQIQNEKNNKTFTTERIFWLIWIISFFINCSYDVNWPNIWFKLYLCIFLLFFPIFWFIELKKEKQNYILSKEIIITTSILCFLDFFIMRFTRGWILCLLRLPILWIIKLFEVSRKENKKAKELQTSNNKKIIITTIWMRISIITFISIISCFIWGYFSS